MASKPKNKNDIDIGGGGQGSGAGVKGFVGQSTKKTSTKNTKNPGDINSPTSRVVNTKWENEFYDKMASEAELKTLRDEAAKAKAAAASKKKSSPLDDYTRQLQALLKGGSYADPYNDLMGKLSGLYGTAQSDLTTNKDTSLADLKTMYDTQGTTLAGMNTTAGTDITNSMNSLETMLKAQANPYANLQAQNVDSSGQLSSFLQGQGVSDQATQDYAQVLNAQNAGSAGAFNNLANVMRSMAGANQQGALGDVATQRTNFTTQLANNNALYKSQLAQGLFADQGKINTGYNQNKFDLSKGLLADQSTAQQGATSQQGDLIKSLLEAIAKGGKPKKGKLF